MFRRCFVSVASVYHLSLIRPINMSKKASNLAADVEKKVTRSALKRKAAEKHSTDSSIDEEADDFREETRTITKKKTTKTKTAKVEEKEQAIKKEAKPQTKRKTTVAKAAVEKPQLKIPEIEIPVKGEIIERPKGPSPWGNGTIKFTDKMYPGAHVSAAGS
jgi:membrane-bound lytic murein transglycosylase B